MKVLFVCRENTCRSVMAEAIFNSLSEKHRAESAGVERGEKIDENAIKTLEKCGYRVEKKYPKSLDDVNLEDFDLIVTVCDEFCVNIPGKKVIRWKIEDPKGKNLKAYERVLKFLEDKIKQLLEEIGYEGS
ncbi:protein tyrosine phosphatase [Ferroglobus placidus DSM 10642]|uniref:Protein tyrosine phosphatase n=1 Tax=Ferroglobus placidus (strain DSM 10642 / AEDII12DO) TaxID=589924 RepID=D3RXB7_FERPA|nr:phosphatase [Ferroglobus placidus]ADC65130.1 protein tyrosine phosphatase [Ferroglobus placidus DSM 10642]